jgi:hypothetical protein
MPTFTEAGTTQAARLNLLPYNSQPGAPPLLLRGRAHERELRSSLHDGQGGQAGAGLFRFRHNNQYGWVVCRVCEHLHAFFCRQPWMQAPWQGRRTDVCSDPDRREPSAAVCHQHGAQQDTNATTSPLQHLTTYAEGPQTWPGQQAAAPQRHPTPSSATRLGNRGRRGCVRRLSAS